MLLAGGFTATDVLAVLGIAALFAGGALTAFSRYRAESIDLLRKTNEDQNARIEFLEGEDKRKTELLETQDRRINDLERMVTGVDAINTLAHQVATYHEEVIVALHLRQAPS